MSNCERIVATERTCYIAIEGGLETAYSEMTEWRTPGGAQVVFDFDLHHRLVGIELLGHQPCMQPRASK